MSIEQVAKPLLWVSSSKKDLMEMPEDVITDFGYGLYQTQRRHSQVLEGERC